MAGSFVAGGVVQPPAAGEGLKPVVRCLAGLLGRPHANWGARAVRISLSRRDLKHTQSPGM